MCDIVQIVLLNQQNLFYTAPHLLCFLLLEEDDDDEDDDDDERFWTNREFCRRKDTSTMHSQYRYDMLHKQSHALRVAWCCAPQYCAEVDH